MIKNISTNQIISKSEIDASSFWRQTLGLMFHLKPRNLIMSFNQTKPRTISLHNFFVIHNLEIIILNKQKQVMEINHSFKPFTFYKAKNKGHYCIEIAKQESKKLCKIGDNLYF